MARDLINTSPGTDDRQRLCRSGGRRCEAGQTEVTVYGMDESARHACGRHGVGEPRLGAPGPVGEA